MYDYDSMMMGPKPSKKKRKYSEPAPLFGDMGASNYGGGIAESSWMGPAPSRSKRKSTRKSTRKSQSYGTVNYKDIKKGAKTTYKGAKTTYRGAKKVYGKVSKFVSEAGKPRKIGDRSLKDKIKGSIY